MGPQERPMLWSRTLKMVIVLYTANTQNYIDTSVGPDTVKPCWSQIVLDGPLRELLGSDEYDAVSGFFAVLGMGPGFIRKLSVQNLRSPQRPVLWNHMGPQSSGTMGAPAIPTIVLVVTDGNFHKSGALFLAPNGRALFIRRFGSGSL